MTRSLLALTLLATVGTAFAQHVHSALGGYAGLQGREIKALSNEQLTDLREGRGMGASLPAELNGVPGPLHVLQLAQELKVSPQQHAALERITAEMTTAAQQLGAQVIAAEAALDEAFRSGTADERSIREATARIADLQGRLRAVHLVAHLRAKRLLSDEQVASYNVARGYAEEPASQRKHR